MKREIKRRPEVVEELAPDAISDVREWLRAQAERCGLKWLLAHSDDGVTWGRMDGSQLVTSDAVAPDVSPPLRAPTLQQARLFDEHGELYLWRDADLGWRARLIRAPKAGEVAAFTDSIDEPQILWGTRADLLPNRFSLMTDGAQGLRHVVPIEIQGSFSEQTRPLRLWVRHYLREDGNGFVRIAASRLVALKMEAGHEQ